MNCNGIIFWVEHSTDYFQQDFNRKWTFILSFIDLLGITHPISSHWGSNDVCMTCIWGWFVSLLPNGQVYSVFHLYTWQTKQYKHSFLPFPPESCVTLRPSGEYFDEYLPFRLYLWWSSPWLWTYIEEYQISGAVCIFHSITSLDYLDESHDIITFTASHRFAVFFAGLGSEDYIVWVVCVRFNADRCWYCAVISPRRAVVGRSSSMGGEAGPLVRCVGGTGGWEPLRVQLPVPLGRARRIPCHLMVPKTDSGFGPGRFLLATASDSGNKSPPLFI